MGALKQIAARGAYFIEIGANDLDVWSQLMINDLGRNMKPFLHELRQWSLIIVQRKAGAQSTKINCWDFKRCNRNMENKRVKELISCPVFTETRLNGINGGKNGGRSCWLIPGTLCGRRIQRSLISKSLTCKLCDFKSFVLREENSNCVVSDKFLNMLIH
jgi:hypothetical protein